MMFSQKTKPEPDLGDVAAQLEQQATAAEIEALAKAPALFAEYEAEHRRQTDGFVFECKRWGDFLTIHAERKANTSEGWHRFPSKISATLNLGGTKVIDLVEGYAPDHGHVLKYAFQLVRDPADGVYWSSDDGYLRHGVEYQVMPDYPYMPASRPILTEDPEQMQHGSMMGNRPPHKIEHSTAGFPRAAKDDILRFSGIKQTLSVPAGMGRAILDQIMAEVERGWDRASLPG